MKRLLLFQTGIPCKKYDKSIVINSADVHGLSRMNKTHPIRMFFSSLPQRGEFYVIILSAILWGIPVTRLFLWKMAESNLFLAERTYFETTILSLGGPLDYAAHALTTLFTSPWTAMPSIALIWCLLTYATSKASHIEGRWAWLNILPGLCALSLAAHMGFGIWVTMIPHVIFLVMLGLFITLICYLLVAQRNIIYAIAILAPLYLACGGWVFLFAGLVMLRRIIFPPSTLQRLFIPAWWTGLMPTLLILALPYCLIRLDLLTLSPFNAYMTHILLFKGMNTGWNTIFSFAILSTVALCFASPLLPDKRWLSLLAAICCLSLFIVAAERNPRLGILLAMEKATKEARWRDILTIDKDIERPHRMMAAYRILALYKTDRIAHDLFRYPVQTTHLTTSVDTLKMNGPLLLYEYGLVLNARKALMEDVVDYGYSPERLRLLGMISCVTLEFGAAYTYFEKLARQPFYKRDAERWLRIIQAHEKPPRDLEHVAATYTAFKKANPLIAMGPSHRLEEDIYTSYQTLKDCPTGMAIFYLMIILLEKTPNKLALNLDTLKRLQQNGELPMALQEGLLFHFATTLSPDKRDQFDYTSFGITTQTQERWNAFLTLHEKMSANPKQLSPAIMRQSFGKTYWYYHLFIP